MIFIPFFSFSSSVFLVVQTRPMGVAVSNGSHKFSSPYYERKPRRMVGAQTKKRKKGKGKVHQNTYHTHPSYPKAVFNYLVFALLCVSLPCFLISLPPRSKGTLASSIHPVININKVYVAAADIYKWD